MYHPANPVSIARGSPEGRPRNLRPERRELDHRMANSLQLAADLLLFEQARIQDADAREALSAAAARLAVIAQLHRCLCAHDQSTGIDLRLFLAEICGLIALSTGLSCSLDADSVVLSTKLTT